MDVSAKAVRMMLLLIVVLAVSLAPVSVLAVDAAPSVLIRQTVSDLPKTTMFVDFTDQPDGGQPLKDIKPEQLKVTIGSKGAVIEQVQPFAKTADGIGYVLLLDVSTSDSMSAESFSQLKSEIKDWLGGLDRKHKVSLVTFGDKATVAQDFTADRNLVGSALDKLSQTDPQAYLFDGLLAALEQANRADSTLPVRRAVIAFSDGQRDVEGNKNKELFEKELNENSIPFYMTGYYQDEPDDKAQESLNTLANYARESRGEYTQQASTAGFAEVFADVKNSLNDSYKLTLNCEACTGDNRNQSHVVELTYKGKNAFNAMNVMVKPKATDENGGGSLFSNPFFWGAVIAGLLLLVPLVILLRRKGSPRASVELDDDDSFEPPPPPMFKEPETAFEPPAPPPVIPSGPSKKIRLVVTNDDDGPTFEKDLAPKLSIGRGKTNEIVLDDNQVSSKHCELVLEDGAVRINDLGSTNGTAVNGVTIHGTRKLESGDVLTIGRIRLRILFS